MGKRAVKGALKAGRGNGNSSAGSAELILPFVVFARGRKGVEGDKKVTYRYNHTISLVQDESRFSEELGTGRKFHDVTDHVLANIDLLISRQGIPTITDEILHDSKGKALRLRMLSMLQDGGNSGPGSRVVLEPFKDSIGQCELKEDVEMEKQVRCGYQEDTK